MLALYPSIKPYSIHQVVVDDVHTLYVEESGNPKGLPVLFVHGGPGAGSSPEHRRFFDPNRYRIVIFDQRGSGQSKPHAELNRNTTSLLVSDMEHIRHHLGIDRWVLFGGSWGATLTLVYAETHPSHVLHLILRGIFLGRTEDVHWFLKPGGASRLFPDAWETFINHLPTEERQDILGNYHRRLIGPDDVARMAAARAWSQWEGTCSTLQPNTLVVDHLTQLHTAMSLARIESHYFMQSLFLEPNQIIKNAFLLADIPGTIIHGRYDIVCPLDNAYELHKAWPGSQLEIIRDAGHASSEPGITNALILATNAVSKQLGNGH